MNNQSFPDTASEQLPNQQESASHSNNTDQEPKGALSTLQNIDDDTIILAPPETSQKRIEDTEYALVDRPPSDKDVIILSKEEMKIKSVGNISEESFDISDKEPETQERAPSSGENTPVILGSGDKNSREMSFVKEDEGINADKSDQVLALTSKMPVALQQNIAKFLLPNVSDCAVEKGIQADLGRFQNQCDMAEQSCQTLDVEKKGVNKDQVSQTDQDSQTREVQVDSNAYEEITIENVSTLLVQELKGAVNKLDKAQSQDSESDIKEIDIQTESSEETRVKNLVFQAVQTNLPEIASLVKDYLEKSASAKELKNQENQEKIIHDRCYCDGCGACPIVGIRYRCAVCDDFDFCENCEATKEHPHFFLKIKKPIEYAMMEQNGRKRSSFSEELGLKKIGTTLKESTLGKVFTNVFEHFFSDNPGHIRFEGQEGSDKHEEGNYCEKRIA